MTTDYDTVADVYSRQNESSLLNAQYERPSMVGPTQRAARRGIRLVNCASGELVHLYGRGMDMLMGEKLAEADLSDWRKLAQGLHARYLVDDFGSAARFVAAVGEAGDALGHHPRVVIGKGYVDLELVSDDAVYRDDDGAELIVEWVTQQDVDLARRISEIAAGRGIDADPSSVSEIELGLDTASSATIAPVWAALLTGNAADQGRGTPSDEVRDARGRLPNLWFGDPDKNEPSRQRFHVEVYVAPEVVEQRITAAVAAGGTVVDDSNAPGLTVIADQEGNRGVICADMTAARTR